MSKPTLKIRIPEEVRAWLDAQTQRNGSTLNSEVLRSIRDRIDAEQAKGNGHVG